MRKGRAWRLSEEEDEADIRSRIVVGANLGERSEARGKEGRKKR